MDLNDIIILVRILVLLILRVPAMLYIRCSDIFLLPLQPFLPLLTVTLRVIQGDHLDIVPAAELGGWLVLPHVLISLARDVDRGSLGAAYHPLTAS